MDLIEKELKKIDFIVKQFFDERDSLLKVTEDITNRFRKIIRLLAPKYSLISSNSVRELARYSFSPRVKEIDSLREKMVRNNLYTRQFNVPDNFNETDGQLIKITKKELLKIDDLIGIKILADLNVDCVKMLELISSPEFKEMATAQNIELDQDDLDRQPQIMRNGLNIYKIKGRFDKYSFELQIKSKIISAWGDMEHAIFYKDYSISPVRDTAQSSMNHVGKLLFDIDDFLRSIRSANKDYTQNAKALTFLTWFDSKYTERLNKKLDKVGYRLDGIAELLYAIYSHLKVSDEIAARALRFSHFELAPDDQILKVYVGLRNNSYDLKILESIVVSWAYKDDFEINDANIDTVLSRYLNLIKEATSEFLCDQHPGYDYDEILQLLTEYHKLAFTYHCNETFLLNINRLNEFMAVRSYITDLSDSLLQEGRADLILKIAFVLISDGNIDTYIANVLVELEIDSSQLKTDIILIRDKIYPTAKKLNIKILDVLENIINHL